MLWLSERFQWFGFNHHKGWTVLIAVAAVGAAAIVMLLWWAAGLILRWRFQFGIRSLLAFCLACSIAVSWLAVEIKQARRQAEAVEAIGSEMLVLRLGSAMKTAGSVTNPAPPGPSWLSNVLGIDFFSVVVAINFYKEPNVTDTELENVKRFANLRKLSLEWDDITDAGLEQLKGLTQLRGLNLRRHHGHWIRREEAPASIARLPD